jgi:ribonuclease VapC
VIVDTSALLAILNSEEESVLFTEKILNASKARLSVASYIEASLRVDRFKDPKRSRMLTDEIRKLRLVLEPVTLEQAEIARAALHDYGRGSGHPARLNYGDAFAYALAKVYDEPLLYKGDDFSHTDVVSALQDHE